MSMLKSVLMDRIGIYVKNRMKSNGSQYKPYSESAVSFDASNPFLLDQLPVDVIMEPDAKNGEPTKGRFSFQSRIQGNGPACDVCRGNYYLSGKKDAPNLVVVHGWKSTSLGSAENIFRDKFLQNGYNVWFMEQPHHITRQDAASTFSGEFMITADMERTIRSVRQAVNDAHALIQWLKRDNAKVALAGVSLGGLVVNLLATMSDLPDALVSVLYATDLAYLMWYRPVGKNIAKDLKMNGVQYDVLSSAWSCLDASKRTPLIDKRRILLMSGKYDQFIPMTDADKLWSSWGKPTRIICPFGHLGLRSDAAQIALDTEKFIKEALEVS